MCVFFHGRQSVLTFFQFLGCTGMPKHRTIADQVTLWHQLHYIAGPKEATACRVCHPARRVCRVRRPIACVRLA